MRNGFVSVWPWMISGSLDCIYGGPPAALQSPKAAIYAVSTVQEEIGLRGVQTSAAAIRHRLVW